MFIYTQSRALRLGAASRNLPSYRRQGGSKKSSEIGVTLQEVATHSRQLWPPSYCGEPLQLHARQPRLVFMNAQKPTTFRNSIRKHLTCPLRRHPRIIVIFHINKNTLASQSHSSRRARAWQRRATSTLKNTSGRRLPLGTPADCLHLPRSRPKQSFTHISLVKAEDLEDKQTTQQVTSEPYVSSSPAQSPSSSSRSMPCSEAGNTSLSDSVSEDQLRLAELATAKLERQSQRITENDPTIPINKPNKSRTARSRAPKQWLPLDFAELSDGDIATTNASRKFSPFDVHAKVFRPCSRDSSPSRGCEPPRKDSAYLSMDEGEFQLVTRRKTKPSSEPLFGLNAHDVDMDNKPSTLSSLSSREINDVFGNDLPPLDLFLTTIGAEDGEVRFAISDNGNISAQQWTIYGFLWRNVGEFSSTRKRIEGNLAAHRDLHSHQQQSLAYFRALAKQQEADFQGRATGTRTLQAAIPNVQIRRVAPKLANGPSLLETLATPNYQKRTSNIDQQAQHELSGSVHRVWGQAYQRLQEQHKSFDSPNESSPSDPTLQRDPATSGADDSILSTIAHDTSPQSLTALNNLSFGAQPTGRERAPGDNNFGFLNSKGFESAGSGMKGPDGRSRAFSAISTAHASNPHIYSPSPALNYSTFLEKAQSQTASATQATALAQRSFTKACLDKIFDAASSRTSHANTAIRTVLHDPFQNQPAKVVPATSKTPLPVATPLESEINNPGMKLSGTASGQIQSVLPSRPSASANTDDPSSDLRISEPDFGYKAKAVEIVSINLPPMSTEELAVYSRPTPQNFNGPFFMGSPDVPSEANRKSHDEELSDWFWESRAIIQRQDEHFQYIRSAHYRPIRPALPKAKPSPIGTPSVYSTPSKKRESEPFNDISTRLCLSVHDSLSQYTQGSLEQRRGYLAPFCDPPEWCIDKSSNGNKSFFGQDWGQPPERISRDSRYRPLPFEAKYSSFDAHRGGNVGGIQPFSGRPRFSQGLNY